MYLKFLPIVKKLIKERSTILILSIIATLSVLFFSLGIYSYKFSFVGDEWPFYAFAKSIIAQNFMVNPFDLNGVYSQNSVLVSMYQAVFMKILGSTNFAWRFSNVALIVPLSIIFYLWVKKSFGKHVAIISTVLLQFSFYLANFFKIGYPQPLFLMFFILRACNKTLT